MYLILERSIAPDKITVIGPYKDLEEAQSVVAARIESYGNYVYRLGLDALTIVQVIETAPGEI